MGINRLFKALADKNRREILLTLKDGKINTGDLAVKLEMTPQALAYHLKQLKEAGLIYETKEKNFIYYELDLTVLDEILLFIESLREEK